MCMEPRRQAYYWRLHPGSAQENQNNDKNIRTGGRRDLVVHFISLHFKTSICMYLDSGKWVVSRHLHRLLEVRKRALAIPSFCGCKYDPTCKPHYCTFSPSLSSLLSRLSRSS